MIRISNNEIRHKATFATQHLRDERRAGLQRAENLRGIKQTALEHEAERLAAKYGADHPRVRRAEARLSFGEGLLADLTVARDQADIEVPDFDKKHLDAARQGVAQEQRRGRRNGFPVQPTR